VAPGQLEPAVLTLTAVPLNPVPGPVTVALTPSVLALVAVPLTAQPSPVTVSLAVAVLALAAVALDPQEGSPPPRGSMQFAARTPASLAPADRTVAGARPTTRSGPTMTGGS
jgi:hypothetical protein